LDLPWQSRPIILHFFSKLIGGDLLESMKEAYKVGHHFGVPVHISHHKSQGEEIRGESDIIFI